MTIRSITDPERFRVQYRGGRRYVDREPADGTWEPTGAEAQRVNAGATFACTWVRFRGGLWRVVLTPEQWATYHRETL